MVLLISKRTLPPHELDQRLDVVNDRRDAKSAEQNLRTVMRIALFVSKLKNTARQAGKEDRAVSPRSFQVDLPEVTWDKLSGTRLVGTGAYADVFAATLDGRQVAIKCLKPEHKTSELAINDIKCEAALLSQMKHPNVLTALGVGPPDTTYLVMQMMAKTLTVSNC